MTMSKNEKGNYSSPSSTLMALGLGVLLSPVTGGASLVYAGCHIGAAAAADAIKNKKDEKTTDEA